MLIIGTLNNGMILLSVPTFYQRVARGMVLIIAVLIENWQMRPLGHPHPWPPTEAEG